MYCHKEILIAPVGMVLYNPPTSTNPYFEAIGSVNLAKVPSQLKQINWVNAAKDICSGKGQLGSNKNFYTTLAKQYANQFKSVDVYDYIIQQLEANKKIADCPWGVKRGRVAEVVRVLQRERKNWLDANKQTIGGSTSSQSTYKLAPTSANLAKIPEQLKKINWQKAAEEICLGSGQLAANKNFYINSARLNANANKSSDVYTFIIDQLEANRTTTECKWGVKRGRIAEVIRVLRREKINWESGITTTDSTSGDTVDAPTLIDRIMDTLFPPEEREEQTGYGTEDDPKDDKPNFTPYIIGGSVILGIALIATFVYQNQKAKK
jgi:hypothetical protein